VLLQTTKRFYSGAGGRCASSEQQLAEATGIDGDYCGLLNPHSEPVYNQMLTAVLTSYRTLLLSPRDLALRLPMDRQCARLCKRQMCARPSASFQERRRQRRSCMQLYHPLRTLSAVSKLTTLCIGGRNKALCCKVKAGPAAPINCPFTTCDINPLECDQYASGVISRRATTDIALLDDEDDFAILEERASDRDARIYLLSGIVLTARAMLYPGPTQYVYTLRTAIRNLLVSWFGIPEARCSEVELSENEIDLTGPPPPNTNTEHAIPVSTQQYCPRKHNLTTGRFSTPGGFSPLLRVAGNMCCQIVGITRADQPPATREFPKFGSTTFTTIHQDSPQ
jgi:hypothetical protein